MKIACTTARGGTSGLENPAGSGGAGGAPRGHLRRQQQRLSAAPALLTGLPSVIQPSACNNV